MTFKQAIDLGGGVRKGEKGSLTVYADKITRTETDAKTGAETEAAIHFMKGYTVFNAEQIDGLPTHYYAAPEPLTQPLPRIERAEAFFAASGARIAHGGGRAYYARGSDHIQLPPFEAFRDAESYTLRSRMRARIGPVMNRVLSEPSASVSAMTPTPSRNSSPKSAPPSYARVSN